MDIHFNSYKVKYDKMDSFMRPIRTSQVIKTVNIFVNVDNIFRVLHHPLTDNEFQACGQSAGIQLISNIFNTLAHYRYWAIKNRMNVKVYGIYTSSMRKFKNSIHIPNYRKKFRENNELTNTKYYFINDAIRSSLPIIPIISNYIPNVYMIDSKYLEPSVVPLYIADNAFKADWNIMITRDVYDLQYSYKDKWSFITPRGDKSKIITRGDIWNHINERERVFKDPIELTYDHNLYIYAKSLVGDTYRNIPRLRRIGWKTLFKYLDMIKDEFGDNDITIPAKNYLIELIQNKKISTEEMNSNIYSTNIEMQVKAMMEIDKTVIDSQLLDIPDYTSLKEMNDMKFSQYPLNLKFLCDDLVQRTPFG